MVEMDYHKYTFTIGIDQRWLCQIDSGSGGGLANSHNIVQGGRHLGRRNSFLKLISDLRNK